MEPFIFELGIRANKVEILHKEGNGIEIKPIAAKIAPMIIKNSFFAKIQ